MINIGRFSEKGKNVILEKKENGCVECISHCKDTDGYVRIMYKGKPERLFRVIYMQRYGDIPKGMVIRHKCDNSSCCNIEHLEIGTQYDNVQDMISRNRDNCHKPDFHSSKLTKEQVKEIYLSNKSITELSKKFNVSKSAISYIKKKKQWKWFTDTLD